MSALAGLLNHVRWCGTRLVDNLPALWREYLADLRRRPLLKRGFQPTRRDFGISLVCTAVCVPIWLLLYWKGLMLVAVILTAMGLVFVSPIAFLLIGVLWKVRRPSLQVVSRTTLQLLFCLGMLIPLNVAGFFAARLSEDLSFQRGNAVASAIWSYRAEHGVFPASLEALERDTGQPLPRPTFCRAFGYETEKDEFTVSFDGDGMMEVWYYDSVTRKWALGD